MKVTDVMTPHVITVGPDNTVVEVAEILLEHGITATPVVDDNGLIGIVSEGDLIDRPEIGTEVENRSWWLRLLTRSDTLAREYIQSHSMRAGDVMTPEVITVTEDATLKDVAAALEKNRIKRVPVVRNHKPVGIASRANLVQRLAASGTAPLIPTNEDDSQIRKEVLKALGVQPWTRIPGTNITVTDGVVEFWGSYYRSTEREADRVAAEGVAGVVRVEDHRV